MEKLTDSSLMPFGAHKGKPLQDIPAKYLLWLRDEMLNNSGNQTALQAALRHYTEDNLDVLLKEAGLKR